MENRHFGFSLVGLCPPWEKKNEETDFSFIITASFPRLKVADMARVAILPFISFKPRDMSRIKTKKVLVLILRSTKNNNKKIAVCKWLDKI